MVNVKMLCDMTPLAVTPTEECTFANATFSLPFANSENVKLSGLTADLHIRGSRF